jgi:hypothetical protein
MLNTSFIERLNGTMRERLAALTRKCRHASCKLHALHTGMYLIGCTYNWCWPHHELSKPVEKGGFGIACTPAMESRLDRSYLECLGTDDVQSRSASFAPTFAKRSPSDEAFARSDPAETTTRSPSEGGIVLVHRLVGFYRYSTLAAK